MSHLMNDHRHLCIDKDMERYQYLPTNEKIEASISIRAAFEFQQSEVLNKPYSPNE